MHCFTPVFFLSRVFTCVFDTNMQVKMQEKYEKDARKLNLFSILHYVLGKNASLLYFSRVFAHVFAHRPYQNATPTHSVIWA